MRCNSSKSIDHPRIVSAGELPYPKPADPADCGIAGRLDG